MRRHRRSRKDELDAHVRIAKAAAELCSALVAIEPQVPDFMFARKVILDGVAVLEGELKAEAQPAGETK